MQAIALAKARYEAARTVFEQRLEVCIREQRREIDPTVFKGLGLSLKQQEVAAFVLSARAVNECEEVAKGRLLVAYGVYRSIADHHGATIDQEAERYETLLLDRERRALEKEATDYAGLSVEQRQKLESAPELQRPFDFVGTLDKLRSTR